MKRIFYTVIFSILLMSCFIQNKRSDIINSISLSLYSTDNSWENVAIYISPSKSEIIYKYGGIGSECKSCILERNTIDSIVKIFNSYTDTFYHELRKQEREGEALYEIYIIHEDKITPVHIIGSKYFNDSNVLRAINIIRRNIELRNNQRIICNDSLFMSNIHREELNQPPLKDSVEFIPPNPDIY